MLDGFGKNFVAGNHYAQIDYFIVIATEYDADDVFSNVVDIAFDGRHQYLATEALGVRTGGKFFFFHKRQQVGDGFFHHTRRLNHLRQEHFSAAEQIADDCHSVHHRAFNDRKAFVVL